MTFGEHIKGLRLAKGWGLREFALRLDVDATYLSRIERDEVKNPPSEEFIVKIAHGLGEDPNVLLGLAGRVSQEIQAIIARRPLVFVELIKAFKEASDETFLSHTKQVRDGEW